MLVRAGAVLRLRVTIGSPRAPILSGAMVGEITGMLDADSAVTWKVVSTTDIAAPSPLWKLFSG